MNRRESRCLDRAAVFLIFLFPLILGCNRAFVTASPTPRSSSNQESVPLSKCVLTIRNPLVPLMSKPDPFSQQLIAVKPGKYTALDYVIIKRANREQGWFQIELEGRKGWIMNDIVTIKGKSSTCP